jgi:hypothetical protein
MTKIKLTENERAVLRGTYDSWYRRGSPPVGHAVWSWSANPWGGAQGRKFGGVVAALMRKGAPGPERDGPPGLRRAHPGRLGRDPGGGVVRQYRTVDTSTVDGVREAEHLLAQGWEIIRTGLFLVYFSRRGRP